MRLYHGALASVLVCVLTGCGSDASRDRNAGQTAADTIAGTEEREVALRSRANEDRKGEYVSPEGGFEVVWPDGCDRIRVRTQTDPNGSGPDDLLLAHIFCDRKGRTNEGCAVTVYFKERDEFGGPPMPQMVIDICKRVMTRFGVDISSQRPVQRGSLQGIQLHCEEPGESGDFWIEGLLYRERIFVLTAWKATGGLFTEPDFIRFFATFELKNP
jgi:hypothetical protein